MSPSDAFIFCSRRAGNPHNFRSAISQACRRTLATEAKPTSKPKKEGDISSVFVSLSGDGQAAQLPKRFAEVKSQLMRGNESKVTASWKRLLSELKVQNDQVKAAGPSIIPSIDYNDLATSPAKFAEEVKHRGVAVVRGVVPEDEARAYKEEVEAYVRQNPWTKGEFSADKKR